MRSISRWTIILLDKQHIRQFVRGSKRRIGERCLDLRCFRWSGIHGWDICRDSRRWWLLTMVLLRRSRLFFCRDIGCIVHWIPKKEGNRVDSKLIRLNIARSSLIDGHHDNCIRSFHHFYGYTMNLDMALLVVWFQWFLWLRESKQLQLMSRGLSTSCLTLMFENCFFSLWLLLKVNDEKPSKSVQFIHKSVESILESIYH